MDFSKRLLSIRDKLYQTKANRDLRIENLNKHSRDLETELALLSQCKEAVLIVVQSTQETQASLEIQMNSIINTALYDVLQEEAYEFNIKFDSRGKVTKTNQIKFELKKNGFTLDESLLDSVGGGVIALCALALRASIMLLSNKYSKVILMDEPLTQLRGNDYERKACALTKAISDKFGIQFVIVTHELTIMEVADNVINLKGNENAK